MNVATLTEVVGSFSQFGQDAFVDRHVFDGKRGGVFVDIGAHDGRSFSNSYLFESQRGWTGVCVEPLPQVFPRLRQNRDCICVQACVAANAGTQEFTMVSGWGEMFSCLASSANEERLNLIDQLIEQYGGARETIAVPCRTLHDILADAAISDVDFLSVDTEGYELDILRTIDFSICRPRCLTIEENGREAEIHRLLGPLGYRLVERLGPDLLYVSQEQADRMRPVGLLRPAVRVVRLAKKTVRSFLPPRFKHA
jgi:FkbM family methyltransferase